MPRVWARFVAIESYEILPLSSLFMMISPAVTLLQLRALVATIDHGGIAKAAAALGVAPSAVSQHLSLLERAVGITLLERQPGPVAARPTVAAQALVGHAREVLRRLDVFGADAGRLRDEQLGHIRLGCFMSVGARILPRLLVEVRRRHHTIEIDLVERDVDEELVEGVISCELDLAFVTLPLRPGPVMSRELLVDPHVLLVPADHRLAGRPASPSVADLAALPLIGFRNDSTEERRLEGVLRSHGLTPRVVLRTDNNLAIPELVARGLGVAVVPRLTLPEQMVDDRLAVVPVPPETIPPRRIGLCWHAERHLGRAAETVIQIAQDICGATGDDGVANRSAAR